jgi:Family of unknown function (DUF6364)
MKNLTLSFDEKLLATARDYAARRGISLNNLIRELVSQVVGGEQKRSQLEDMFEMADASNLKSSGKRWSREDIYDV